MKLDNRTAELVAVGTSIASNCQPCLQYHIKKALESGADKEEIVDAIEIGKMVRKGAATKMDKFAANLDPSVPVAVGSTDAGCGCDS